MTWRGKGRSGIGDQYLTHEPWSGSSYEDWDGVSPNGKQFKNAFTQEVRDLSGAEYWKARKANNPTECDLENHFNGNGSANVKAYAERPNPTGRQAKQKSKQGLAQDLLYQINPDEKKLDILDEKEQALTTAYVDGLIEAEQYEKAIETLIRKRYALHKKIAKDNGDLSNSWIEEHGTYEDKKNLYNSKSYLPSLQVQARLLASLKPKETTFNKIINWLRNN